MTAYLCSVSPAVVFWSGAIAGGTFMAIIIMGWLAVYERIVSRRLVRQAEHGVDITLPTGGKRTLLLAPEAAAQ
jgi:hypothetical protein